MVMQGMYADPVTRPAWMPGVKWIMIVTTAVLVVQALFTEFITGWFSLIPVTLLHGQIWRLFTYMLLHDVGSFFHILFNMLMLYMLGQDLERSMGWKRFVAFYIVCGLIAGIGWSLLSILATPEKGLAMCIGASGAVYGVMAAYGACYPNRVLMLLFPPIPMRARTFVFVLMGISLLFSVSGGGGNVAHAAHLFGGVAGYLYGLRIQPYVSIGVPVESDNPVSSWLARRRRSKIRVVKSAPDEKPDQEEVDRILEKITKSGMDSLSPRELDALNRASRNR